MSGNNTIGILQKLHHFATETPEKKVWTFLNDKGEPNDSYTFKELEVATDYVCDYLLTSCKVKKGDRILLVFFPGLDFMAALLACFKAELIAVPVFPPDPRRLKKDLHHFISIQRSSEAVVALTNSQYNFVKKVEDIKNIFSSEKWPDIRWILVDDQLKKGRTNNKLPSKLSFPTIQSIAFLQYTSGSTSEPKGVMISHENLAHNLSLIIHELKADQSTVNISWLPQYHDMGLIGSYLGVLYCGGEGYYLSPISFLKEPMVWIRTLSKYRATHTQAPNFAYALVSRKFKETDKFKPGGANLNLSSLRHAINAAEPVDYSAIMQFYEDFTPYGLRGDVIFPTYGLAEHTVFVCSGGKSVVVVKKASIEKGKVEILGEDELVFRKIKDNYISEEAQRIVGCGIPGNENDVEVVIVDPETAQRLPDDRVGEIWVHSNSKAKGYWNLKDLSREDFEATIHGEDQTVTYLRTGDLGFVYKGELYICGRLKDMIIIGGSNHYPQDIERTIEKGLSDQLRPGCTAAFALHPTEEIVFVAEIKEGITSSQFEYIVQLCRELVAIEHGITMSTILLIETRTIPKTTSGKIARAWCRKAYLEKKLQILYRSDADQSDLKQTANLVDNDLTPPPGEAGMAKKASGYMAIPSSDGKGEIQRPSLTNGATGQGNEKLMMKPDGTRYTQEEVRAMDRVEIARKLESTLIQVSSIGPSQLNAPLDNNVPLTSFGLDSMTIVQFKGVLENRFFADIPDEFVFSTMATIYELSVAVKEGKLTAEQKHRFDSFQASSTPQAGAGAAGAANPAQAAGTTIVVSHRQPCCPWFTCCL